MLVWQGSPEICDKCKETYPMNPKLKNGELTFSITEILDNLDGESKIEFIETLACDEVIIEHVASQIITGLTSSGCSGAKNYNAQPNPTFALDKAIREIAKTSSDLARKEIERLESALKESEKKYYDLLYNRQ